MMATKLTRRQAIALGGSAIASTAIPAGIAAATTVEVAEAAVVKPPRANLYDTILELMTEQYGVTMHEIFSDDRSRRVVHPRQMGMYLGYMFTNNICEVGRRIGGRDGAPVLHACRKLERQRQTDPVAAAEINRAVVRCVRAMRAKNIPINRQRYAKARWFLKMGRPRSMPSWRIEKYGQAFVDYERIGWVSVKMRLPG